VIARALTVLSDERLVHRAARRAGHARGLRAIYLPG
jgi:hypothetical protein